MARLFTACILLTLLLVPVAAGAQAVNDPRLSWRSIRTAHFDIHYHEPLGVQARRVAVVAEHAREILERALGYAAHERVQIVLTDDTDSSNGSATALPYNTIRLYSTAPEDLSELADYDDWATALVNHEHTHIVHLDQIRGIPALVNAIFGKILAPNQSAPRWLLEGLAVFEETETTSSGRLRSTMWDMMLRADALQDRLLRIDQMTHEVDRWPHGDVWYLYGSEFVQFIARRYGRDVLRQITERGSIDPTLPLFLNFLPREGTGKNFGAIYDEFLASVRERYRAQANEIASRGIVEGTRLTFHGEIARSPRFLPDGRIAYFAADAERLSELRVIDPHTPGAFERVANIAGNGSPAVMPGGDELLASGLAISRNIYEFNDLYRVNIAEHRATRITHGMRSTAPDVSADGRRVVFVVNGAGTTHLAIANADDIDGTEEILFRNERFNQVYSPRISPDGHTVAASFWRAGGYRDIGLVDIDTGARTMITDDRFLDTGPAWSPDGTTIYFASDRTGVSNIYAYNVATHTTLQVTNVTMGAYMPDVSSDGKSLAYVGYTSWGWDIFALDLSSETFREAANAPTAAVSITPRSNVRPSEGFAEVQSTRYSAFPTALPTSWMVDLTPDAFGQELGVATSGQDVVGFHAYTARVGTSLVRGDTNLTASYAYSGLPVALHISGYRNVIPGGGYTIFGRGQPWIEDTVGGEIDANYTFRDLYHSNSVNATYALAHYFSDTPLATPIDPNEPRTRLPRLGNVGQLRAGWNYSSLRRFAYDISTSQGMYFGINASVIDPVLLSSFRAGSVGWTFQTYARMPWLQHHVLAFRYAGGIARDSRGIRAAYSVGGFPDVNLVSALTQLSFIGGVALRGYRVASHVGDQYHLAQLEYRFPIWRTQLGHSTLPIYFNRIYGLAFADFGDAFFGAPNLSHFRTGVGAELLIDLTVLYYTGISLRVGIAQGVNTGGLTQFYANLGSPF